MKHLATVSAQETKAKGEKMCVIERREGREKRGKTHLNHQAEQHPQGEKNKCSMFCTNINYI